MPRNKPLPTILIVEDDPFDVWLLKNNLAAVGADHPVVVCEDGREACEWLRELSQKPAPTPPALLLVDLRLPEIDGFTLIRWIRSQRVFVGTAIVVVSGSLDPEDAKRAFAAGADHFIAKPADADTIQQVLENIGLLDRYARDPALG